MAILKKKYGCDSKKNKSVVLFCGQGRNAAITGTSDPLIPIPSAIRIADITVDTRGMEKPVVEIEFSSTVSFLASDDDAKASLSFVLFRSCNNEEPMVVNSWPYEVFQIENSNNNVRLSTSVVFNFCECLKCTGCCKYFVEVFIGGLEDSSLFINNVDITALAGESECSPKSTLSKSSRLFCGEGGKAAFINPTDPPAIAGNVLVDAKDICKPTVSLEYSSNISFLATNDGLSDVNNDDGAEGRVRFDLFRTCNNKSPELLNSWVYEIFQIEDADIGTRFIDSFSFNFCDFLPCPGCCEYFVKVSLENLLTAIIVVNNVHITALVQ